MSVRDVGYYVLVITQSEYGISCDQGAEFECYNKDTI